MQSLFWLHFTGEESKREAKWVAGGPTVVSSKKAGLGPRDPLFRAWAAWPQSCFTSAFLNFVLFKSLSWSKKGCHLPIKLTLNRFYEAFLLGSSFSTHGMLTRSIRWWVGSSALWSWRQSLSRYLLQCCQLAQPFFQAVGCLKPFALRAKAAQADGTFIQRLFNLSVPLCKMGLMRVSTPHGWCGNWMKVYGTQIIMLSTW